MASGRPVPPDVIAKYVALRDEGFTRTETARRCGVSKSWAYLYEKNLKLGPKGEIVPGHNAFQKVRGAVSEYPAPKVYEELSPEAKRAHDDIRYFAQRYFGVRLMPFQTYSTGRIMELAATDDEEYVVINSPPGSGKSTFFTLILPAWLTVRQRTIRGLIGSATDTSAKWYVGNLKDALTTPYAITADPESKKRGIAQDAEATLVADFGRFKPEVVERKFASDAFFVELPEGIASGQKEPTWSAFGRSSNFLGLRVPFAIWDDVYDPAKNRSGDSRDELKTWWSDVAEKRLEPGGLLLLQMQRLDPDDICRYALDMGGTILRGEDEPKKYHHIKFKAHYDELCAEDHGPDALPYLPENPAEGGCLLYPKRLPWSKLEAEQRNNPNFEMVYNQADVAAAAALVDRLWIDGGTDPATGEVYGGCTDKNRDLAEIPKNLAGKLLSVVTADPSPTQYWAIQWWGVRCDPEPEERYLLDLHREKMGANDLLDWNHERSEFTGILHDWWKRSCDLGAKITHVILEDNVAQRFMLQYEHAKRWSRHTGVQIIRHNTNRNKADPVMGVQSIASHYRYGRVRLPYRSDTKARLKIQKLIDELIRWPRGRTDDCVMAHWFLEWNLNTLKPRERKPMVLRRPSWMAA